MSWLVCCCAPNARAHYVPLCHAACSRHATGTNPSGRVSRPRARAVGCPTRLIAQPCADRATTCLLRLPRHRSLALTLFSIPLLASRTPTSCKSAAFSHFATSHAVGLATLATRSTRGNQCHSELGSEPIQTREERSSPWEHFEFAASVVASSLLRKLFVSSTVLV